MIVKYLENMEANVFETLTSLKSMIDSREAVKPQDRVLILADNEPAFVWLAQLLNDVMQSIGAETVLALINPPILPMKGADKEDVQSMTPEPPEAVVAAMKRATAIFRISDKRSLVHTVARREITAAGIRYYMVQPDIAENLKRRVAKEEFQRLVRRTESIAAMLGKASSARLVSSAGTDLRMNLAGRNGVPLHPMSGAVRSLDYYAEAAVAPLEGSAEGTIVADLAVVQWGHLLTTPLRYAVKAGRIVDISGDKADVDRMHKLLATDKNANNVAELGIGTSHLIPMPLQGKRRDAGRLGTAHIGVGRNSDIGGATSSQLHVDSLIDRVTLELDGQCLLRDGTLNE
jgi:leucyl aminopeptidase (aminopeptidase T)